MKVTSCDEDLSNVFFVKLPCRVGNVLCGVTTIMSRKRILTVIPGAFLPGCGRFCRTERFTSKRGLDACIALGGKRRISMSASFVFDYGRLPGLGVTIRLYRSL